MINKMTQRAQQASGLFLCFKTLLFANFAHYGDDLLKEIEDRRGVQIRAIWWSIGDSNP